MGSRRRAAAIASPSLVCAFSRIRSASSSAWKVARSTAAGPGFDSSDMPVSSRDSSAIRRRRRRRGRRGTGDRGPEPGRPTSPWRRAGRGCGGPFASAGPRIAKCGALFRLPSSGPLRYSPSSTVTRSGTGVRRFASSWSVECHTAAESLAPGRPMAPRTSCSWAVMSPSGGVSASGLRQMVQLRGRLGPGGQHRGLVATAEPGDLSRCLGVGGWPRQTPARPVLGDGHHVRHHVADRPAGTGRELHGPCRRHPRSPTR